MNTLRVFFAIDLPSSVRNAVHQVILKLQKQHKREPIRWTRVENLHVTLQFLAALQEEHLEPLIKNMQLSMNEFPSFELQLQQIELFPTPYHSRIISLSMQPQDVLKNLSECMGKVIEKFGYEVEKRPYRGHLTLARLNDPKHFILGEIEQPKFKKFSMNEVLLYRSQPSAQGSHYTVIGKCLLGKPHE